MDGSPGIGPHIKAFVRAFNDRDFFGAHEILEIPWREVDGPYRKDEGLRGLIFLAAAYVHRERGNDRGVRDLLAKAERALGPRAPLVHGVDVTEAITLIGSRPWDASFPLITLRAPTEGREGGT